jgi:hypothetical protein
MTLEEFLLASYVENRHRPDAAQQMQRATERAVADYNLREFGRENIGA